jgi:REP element-mobilizing transposase RayT
MEPIRERPHRLPDSHHVGQKAVVFTVCIDESKTGLHRPEIADPLIELLEKSLNDHNCRCAIYCIMPDHLNAMIVGNAEDSDTKQAFVSFKIRSGRWLTSNSTLRWQKSYWDHIVRYFETWESQARYIALNPVRKGLAETVLDWSYAGSIGCNFSQIIEDAFD